MKSALHESKDLPWQQRASPSVEHAAEILGVSRKHAYNRITAGEIRSVRLGQRIVIPARLRVPLPPEAVKAAQAGRGLHDVLKAAEPPPPLPTVEVKKKPVEAKKGTPAKIKIFGRAV